MGQLQESEWNGYRKLTFLFQGREALLIFPKDVARTPKWMLKTEYFGAFPQLELDMLAAGYHLAYLKNLNRWGVDDDQRAKRDFAEYLSASFGLARKCVCIGMSCGGFHAVNFASRYPSYVSLLYLDAPLLSFCGWSKEFEGGAGWAREQMDAYGFVSRSEIYVHSDQPIHRLHILTENKIPVALVYGGKDKTVDPFQNAEMLADYYRAQNAPIRVWIKPECDHHPHGPESTSEVIEYIESVSL
ncbi:MAG: prolyl oligopeptidase family serine peptidase [Clostridia bacterium]|nr:prolyl oligopeptidase family serine peptidase [Clostridia bacterium]